MENNKTVAILNESEEAKQFYSIEGMIRAWSKEEGWTVISLFDCCRNSLKKIIAPATKGGADAAADDQE